MKLKYINMQMFLKYILMKKNINIKEKKRKNDINNNYLLNYNLIVKYYIRNNQKSKINFFKSYKIN